MSVYAGCATKFKALSDHNRLMIIETLMEGELCGCKILAKFHFTQPTLSHHMKILCDAGLTNCRKDGKWCHYSVNPDGFAEIISVISPFTKK